jgi:putative FmdB family regulatory protein
MPLYEYLCHDCQEQVSLFFRSFAEVETKAAICPQCGGGSLERVISKVAVVQAGKGEQTGAVNPSSQSTADQSDPKALARLMREAGQGQDFGREFKEVATRLEAGEKPAAIENSLRKRAGQSSQTH